MCIRDSGAPAQRSLGDRARHHLEEQRLRQGSSPQHLAHRPHRSDPGGARSRGRPPANVEIEGKIIEIVTVNYARAPDVVNQLKSMLSTRGSVGTDERTDTV